MAEPVTTLTPEEFAVLMKIVGGAPGGMQLMAGVQIAEPPVPGMTTIQTLPPEVSFLTTKIPPPAPFYLAREDQLLVSIWNSVAGATVFLGMRFLRPDGAIVPVLRTYTPTSTRARNDFTIPPSEGFLLGLHLGTATVSQPGQCYVTVLVNRPKAPTGTELHTLLAGYVTTSFHPTWPGTPLRDARDSRGAFRVILGTTPASGAELNEVVPTGALWVLHAFQVPFTSNTAAVTRYPSLLLDDGANVFYRSPLQQTVAASQAWIITWSEGVSGYVQVNSTYGVSPLPINTFLTPGYRIRSLTPGLQATEGWGQPIYLVEEWIQA